MKTYYVYILSSITKRLYIGFTSNLEKRIQQHKTKTFKGHTAKYNINRLVYFEETNDVQSALQREKQFKHWKREWKIELIEENNPQWKDLYSAISL